MARQKQYATAAERQAAYRERRRGNVTNVTEPCTMIHCALITPDARALMDRLKEQGWILVKTEHVDWYGGTELYYYGKDTDQIYVAIRKDGTGRVEVSSLSYEGEISGLVDHLRGKRTHHTHNPVVVYRIPGSAGGEALREVIGVDNLGRFATKAYPPSWVKGQMTMYVDATWCRAATPDDIERLMRQTVERNVTPTPVTFSLCFANTARADLFLNWLYLQGFVEVPYSCEPWTDEGTIMLQKEHMSLKVTPLSDGTAHIGLCDGIVSLVDLLRSQ